MTVEQTAARKGPRLRRVEVLWLVLVVGALAGLVGLGWYARHTRLWLVNGLDVAVVVELDGRPRPLAAGERTSEWVRLGLHHARVLSAAGVVLDEDALAVAFSGSDALHVYNVLGAAPVLIETIAYSNRPVNERREAPIELFGGLRFLAVERVDHPFEAPPKSLSTKQPSSAIYRRHADVAPGSWRTTINYLAAKDMGLAARVALDVSRAQPEDAAARAVALQLAASAGGATAAAANLAEEMRESFPEDADVHRVYQTFRAQAGRGAELSEEYGRWYAAGEKTPQAASLYARVLPLKEARAVLDEALGRHPEASELLLRKGLLAMSEGNAAEAEGLFARAAGGADYSYFVDEHATALVILGRPAEALERLSQALAKDPSNFEQALLYAQIARRPGNEAAVGQQWRYVDALSAAPEVAWRRTWARSALGDPSGVSSGPVSGANRGDGALDAVHLRAGENPAEAWKAVAALAPAAYRNLHGTVAILLGAELGRVGDLDLAEKLLGPRHELPLPWRAVIDYVTAGTEAPGFFRLHAEHRAALDFVRARALEAEGKPAEAHYEAARRGDALHSVVSRAMASWKKVKGPAAGK